LIKTGLYYNKNENIESVLDAIHNVYEMNIVGIYSNTNISDSEREIIQKYKLNIFEDYNNFLSKSDAIISLSSQENLSDLEFAIKKLKHIYLYPDFDLKIKDIERLNKLSKEADVKVQITSTNVEYNDAFYITKKQIKEISFIETNYYKNIIDKDVFEELLRMLFNSIDTILSIEKSRIRRVEVKINSNEYEKPSIINVRLYFYNSCYANIIVGNSAIKQTHQVCFYGTRNCVDIDILKNKAWFIQKKNKNTEKNLFSENIGELLVEPILERNSNRYLDGIKSFAQAILTNKRTEIDLDDFLKYHYLQNEIKQKIMING